MSPSLALSRSTRTGAVRRGAPRRRGRRLLRAAAVAALAAAPLRATPRSTPAMTPETYMACVNMVTDFVDGCVANSDTWLGDLGCEAAGVGGILLCAAAEAAEILARSIIMPRAA